MDLAKLVLNLLQTGMKDLILDFQKEHVMEKEIILQQVFMGARNINTSHKNRIHTK